MSAVEPPGVRVAIGADEVGLPLKEEIEAFLATAPGRAVRCIDPAGGVAGELDAMDVAQLVAESVRRGDADRGILICGSGVGMVVTANKVPGIRAAQCHDVYTAQHARQSNDAQIIVLGSRVIGVELAKTVVGTWLNTEFEPNEARRRRMAKLAAIEAAYLQPVEDVAELDQVVPPPGSST